ncbi:MULTISPECIES: hypothetical protein [unclassified Serratia (in: enterobacteria)]|uniref:hypothetical protein n=1 Tax=unclassified Serratia (in: enterobacteria) TaxID=2647522 RepID=UPI0005084B1B|nr:MULTISPECIES: hypothetical protein [unclassified Serratia (in: enterobacteria)]KFK95024.1 prophage protein [Serratia sp. Ag1]KFK96685.1 prophage protein [Serratia sp. Ag2]
MGVENSNSGLYLHVDFDQTPEITFNKARVRRAFVTVGQKVMAESRRIVARRAISKAGEVPGFRTGRLAKSIGYRVPTATATRPGFMAKIAPNQKGGKGNRLINGDFYPAFLWYGVRRGARRGKSHKKGASGGSNWKIAPRKNFMEQALLNKQAWIERVLFEALQSSVRPVKK